MSAERRKIVQLMGNLYALCDDGSVWEWVYDCFGPDDSPVWRLGWKRVDTSDITNGVQP